VLLPFIKEGFERGEKAFHSCSRPSVRVWPGNRAHSGMSIPTPASSGVRASGTHRMGRPRSSMPAALRQPSNLAQA
jgi:hypothetical protein